MHAAVVELSRWTTRGIILDRAEWYPGDENGLGGIYNFVTKRGDCPRRALEDFVDPVETGSAIT